MCRAPGAAGRVVLVRQDLEAQRLDLHLAGSNDELVGVATGVPTASDDRTVDLAFELRASERDHRVGLEHAPVAFPCGLFLRGVGGNYLNLSADRVGKIPVPVGESGLFVEHVDAVHRAGFHAEITASALARDHRVHLLGCTENRVNGARLDALRAADALCLADVGDRGTCIFLAVFFVKRDGLDIEEVGQRLDARFTPGRALIDGIALGDGLGVGAAARVAALPALGLRQDVVDLVGNGVAFGFELHRGKAEDCAEDECQADQCDEGCQQRVL